MTYRILVVVLFILSILIFSIFAIKNIKKTTNLGNLTPINKKASTPTDINPLAIIALRKESFTGSRITIEKELGPGLNYKQYIASYISDGLKIYGLLTVPDTKTPETGYPAIVFDHGYIPPEQYETTERYVVYVDNLARAGYVVFKIDYRGNGNSQGSPVGAYFSPGYTIDTLNAAQSLKTLNYVDKDKIGVWGHSMAGMIITRALVVKPYEFKAAVIWGGAVGSYQDLSQVWWSKRRPRSFTPSAREQASNRPSRDSFTKLYGQPSDTSEFWKSISPPTYINDIKTPIQLDHGEADEEVPTALSELFAQKLKADGKTFELYTYPGADHNISSPAFELAMQRTIDFFDKYLK